MYKGPGEVVETQHRALSDAQAAYYQEQDYERAAELFEKVLKELGDDEHSVRHHVWQALSDACLKVRRYDGVQRYTTELIEEDPSVIICSLISQTIPRWKRFEVAKELFDKKHECCLRGAHALVARWATVDDAFAAQNQQILSGYHHALEELLSIADMERRHKRAKGILKSGDGKTTFPAFCGASLVADAQMNFDAAAAGESSAVAMLAPAQERFRRSGAEEFDASVLDDAPEVDAPPLDVDMPLVAVDPPPPLAEVKKLFCDCATRGGSCTYGRKTRARSAFQFWQKEMSLQQESVGRMVTFKDVHSAEMKATYKGLPQATRDQYEAQALVEKNDFAMCRQSAKVGRQAADSATRREAAAAEAIVAEARQCRRRRSVVVNFGPGGARPGRAGRRERPRASIGPTS